jgi:hypothetical protein
MAAYAADYNAYVEPLRDPDSAGWTPTNSVATSNHLNGTAMDLNWDTHPFRVADAGYNAAMRATMHEILDFYEGTMFWANEWDNPKDSMHHQMGYSTWDNQPKIQDFIRRKVRADGFSTFRRGALQDVAATTAAAAVPVMAAATEKVLPYNHVQQLVAQEKGFDCCPASVQIVLNGLGVEMSENDLIAAIGTTTDGTNTVEQALPILNQKTAGKYVAVWLPNDPPRDDQREALWHNVKGSIDAGFGCVLNFEVPSTNFPRGTRGSASPQYRGQKVWHYVSCMGYADDGPGGRHLWIADPGFPPFDKGGYWMSLEQAATAIPPHAYAYATVQAPQQVSAPQPVQAPPAVTQVSVPQPTQPVAQQPVQPVIPAGQYASRSGYRNPGEGSIGDVNNITVNDDAMVHTIFVEWSAVELGDIESIYRIVRSAAGLGADTSRVFVKRARAALAKIPRDALEDTLVRIEKVEPDLLRALTGERNA